VQRADGSEVLLVPDGDPDRLGSVTTLARRTVAQAEALRSSEFAADASTLDVAAPPRRSCTLTATS